MESKQIQQDRRKRSRTELDEFSVYMMLCTTFLNIGAALTPPLEL